MIFILDNGHGKETPGKRSPQWPDLPQIFEWEYNRMIVNAIHERLKCEGIKSVILVPEEWDVTINTRARRANDIALSYGYKNALLVSVHLNAADNEAARGWEVHTYLGTSISDTYATIFWEEAQKYLNDDTKMRGDWQDGTPDWDSNFGMLRLTNCPAVLTENCFMTNKQDCRYLLSEEGKREIVALHVDAMKRILTMR